ncbi:uncharacterized protein LOC101856752 [Aplysia californica]|uniref:Uncharacterized protein LOC101856752 n=1 Tax=Aplysia californica TaxID=6500 RepID=A0ABM1VYT7_APLCA|nr:uncharacterized protein LOC101856752 [Aplysia californica]
MSAVRTWMQIYLLCFLTLQQQTRVSSVDLKIPRFEKFDELRQRVEGHRAADYLLLPHIYRAFINAGSPLSTMSNVSVSGNCLSNLKYYYTALQRRKAWAWKMYDATGKQSSGVFLGATTWTGNYEECLDHFINYQRIRGLNQRPEKVTDVGPVTPHYCSVHMTHAPWMPQVIDAYDLQQLPFPVPYSPFIVDVCVPQNCSELDIHQIVNAFLKLDYSGDNITVSSVTCHHRRPISEDVPALLSAIFLFLLLTLVVLGTAFDIFRRRRKLRVKYGPEITIGYDEETDKFGVLKILLTPRKRKGRRGTLSSSELLDSTLIKDTQLNGSSTDRHTSSRRRTVSECASGDPATRPLFQRMSSAPAHADLQDIPEDIEIKTLSERVVSPATAALGSGSVMSDDESTGFSSDPSVAEIGESRGNVPALSDSDGSCSPVPCEREAGYNRKASIIEVRPSHRVKKLTSSENLFTDLLLSFSFRKNTRHILAEGSGDTLFCLNGVRVLSITWIVLGNVYGIIYQNPAVVGGWALHVCVSDTFLFEQ